MENSNLPQLKEKKYRWWEDQSKVDRLTELLRDDEMETKDALEIIGISWDQLDYYRKFINKDFHEAHDWRWWESDPSKTVKLEIAFSNGCTDNEACIFAKITPEQLYYYQEKFPDLLVKKKMLKESPGLLARQYLVEMMKPAPKPGDTDYIPEMAPLRERMRFFACKHYADRKLPDYKPKQQLELEARRQPVEVIILDHEEQQDEQQAQALLETNTETAGGDEVFDGQ